MRASTSRALVRLAIGLIANASKQRQAQVRPVDVGPPPTQEDQQRALAATEQFIGRYVAMSDTQLVAVTLWVAHTWAVEASSCTPYIAVSSTEPRCGKTRLLEVVELLVRQPLRTSDVTEAALFNAIDLYSPTILLDEFDTVFKGNKKSREGLRALLNAGYRRGSPVQRVRGGKVYAHDVYGAKILAGIGTLPDTVADRSIHVRLTRRTDQIIDRFRAVDARAEGEAIHNELSRCFGHPEVVKTLGGLRIQPISWLNDRAQDSWEPLMIIAQVVGGNWPRWVIEAAHALSGGIK